MRCLATQQRNHLQSRLVQISLGTEPSAVHIKSSAATFQETSRQGFGLSRTAGRRSRRQVHEHSGSFGRRSRRPGGRRLRICRPAIATCSVSAVTTDRGSLVEYSRGVPPSTLSTLCIFKYKYIRMNRLSVETSFSTDCNSFNINRRKWRIKSVSVESVEEVLNNTQTTDFKRQTDCVESVEGGGAPLSNFVPHSLNLCSRHFALERKTFRPSWCLTTGPSSMVIYLMRSLKVFVSMLRRYI